MMHWARIEIKDSFRSIRERFFRAYTSVKIRVKHWFQYISVSYKSIYYRSDDETSDDENAGDEDEDEEETEEEVEEDDDKQLESSKSAQIKKL